MPFNSDAYHRNKARAEALERLAEARRIKAGDAPRYKLGDSAYWISSAARLARISWRLYLLRRHHIATYGRESRCGIAPYQPAPWRTRLS